MPAFREYDISFRAHHPSADPAQLAGAFRWIPKRSWRAGRRRTTGSGRSLPGYYKTSYVTSALSSPRFLPLPEFVNRILDHLERQSGLLQRWKESGGTLDLWIGLYLTKPAGDTLEAATVARCAERGLDLCILISPFRMPVYEGETRNVLKPIPRRIRPS